MITRILTSQPHAGAEHVLAPDVALLVVRDGTSRLLDMGGCFHAVPAVGTLMLLETLQHGARRAAERIAEKYGVDAGRARRDLDAFLSDCTTRGLLRPAGDRPRRKNAVLPGLLLRPALALAGLRRSWEARAAVLLPLARLSFGLFGWTRTVAVWTRAFAPPAAATQPSESMAQAIDEGVRAAAARQLVQVECKERGLTCWALARSAGLAASLVVGVNLFPLAGHCWCEAGAWTLSDDRDRCDRYQPVIRYA